MNVNDMSELSSESTDDRFMHSEPLDHELSNDSSNEIILYKQVSDAQKQVIELQTSNLKLSQKLIKALTFLNEHASEVPKNSNLHQYSEVYVIPKCFMLKKYHHLNGYKCIRAQKRNLANARPLLSKYRRLYLSRSPNAINALNCLKDRLMEMKNQKHDLEIKFDGNKIYTNLNEFEMVNLLDNRSFKFDEDLNETT